MKTSIFKISQVLVIFFLCMIKLQTGTAQTNLYSGFNPDFEGINTSATGNTPYYWWNFYNDATASATLTNETTPANVHGGSNAGKIVVATAASNYQPQLAGQAVNGLNATHTYQVSAWVKSKNGVGKIQACNGGGAPYLANTTVTTTWMQYTTTFTGLTSFNPWFNVGGTVETFYIDDVALLDVTPLPVNLMSFSASKTAFSVVLNWSTSNEINNNYFGLERSGNSVDFSNIGTVASKATNGNSSSVLNYSFQDDLKNVGSIGYYRLKQVDVNGTASYSNIVSVTNDLAVQAVAVYPNPIAGNKFTIRINTATNENAVIKMMNADGKMVVNKVVQLNEGVNFVSLNNDNLSKGPYILQVYNATSQQLIGSVKTVK